MLDFLFFKKRTEVSRILTGRMNQHYIATLDAGERKAPRASYCEVVWLLADDHGRPDFDSAVPVVSKDISPAGISLIHSAPVEEQRVIIGLRQEDGMTFIRCRRGHSTPLGCGFFQIGLSPEEIVRVSTAQANDLRRRYDRHVESAEPVTVG